MSGPQKHQIYDYLLDRYKTIGYQSTNPFQETSKITALQRKLSRDDQPEIALEIGELIYSLILHHDRLSNPGFTFRARAYDGRMMGKNSGIHYETRKMPVMLVQLIFILINEIIEGVFPFFKVEE